MTREHADALPYASMFAWFDGSPKAFMVLGEVRGDNLVWFAADRRTIVTRGCWVVATGGLPVDLTAVQSPRMPASPLAVDTWRRQVDFVALRKIGWPVVGTFEKQPPETIEILERRHETVPVTETVTPEGQGSFENEYFADPQTGRCWKSRQHVVPGQPALNIEVLKPYEQ